MSVRQDLSPADEGSRVAAVDLEFRYAFCDHGTKSYN
jgi:hypothetical protein